jgi:hypothetical protein
MFVLLLLLNGFVTIVHPDYLKSLLAMPKYPMNAKIKEIIPIASLFVISKVRPIATIPINPKIIATPTLLASFLEIVVPLKPTL